MFRRPAFGLAEVAWRWSFGLAVWALLAFSSAEYFDTLPVTRGDLLLLKTRQPALILRAVFHIFHGSGARVARTSVVLALSLIAAWIVVAGLARAATIKALLGYFRAMNPASAAGAKQAWRVRSLFGLNFFRVAAFLAAAMGCLAPFIAARRSPSENAAPGATFLIFVGITTLVCGAWCVVNWFLSLAALFAAADGEDTFGAMAATINFCRTRLGLVCAVGTWFGLAHLGAFVIATFLALFAMGLLGALPAAVAFGGMLCVTLLYFAVADFLYIGRLAAYVAILELPAVPVAETVQPHPSGGDLRSAPISPPSNSIDESELILSDLPGGGQLLESRREHTREEGKNGATAKPRRFALMSACTL